MDFVDADSLLGGLEIRNHTLQTTTSARALEFRRRDDDLALLLAIRFDAAAVLVIMRARCMASGARRA